MKNKFCSKGCLKGCLLTLFTIICAPIFIYMFLHFYSKFHSYNRTFVADIKSIGYKMSFSEIEHDSILAFSFIRKGDNKEISTLFLYNNVDDVVSFIFTDDTIYIRDKMEYQDLFPPEERESNTPDLNDVGTLDFQRKGKLVKGNIPSPCRLIPYIDSRFFTFDRTMHKYIPKDSTTHEIILIHCVERGNDYVLWDESLKDTLWIDLIECTK